MKYKKKHRFRFTKFSALVSLFHTKLLSRFRLATLSSLVSPFGTK
ncbi:hypothetical protein KSS87_023741 [Heliosperma pusillum]|nr:hypothetical protein KSS87_023741 [Heliosperma pusillum]